MRARAREVGRVRLIAPLELGARASSELCTVLALTGAATPRCGASPREASTGRGRLGIGAIERNAIAKRNTNGMTTRNWIVRFPRSSIYSHSMAQERPAGCNAGLAVRQYHAYGCSESDGGGALDSVPGGARAGGARFSTRPLRATATRRSLAPLRQTHRLPTAPQPSNPSSRAASRCVRTRRRAVATCTPVSLSSPASSSPTTWAWASRAAGGNHRRSHLAHLE
jgi:hypothetical protein